MDSGKQDVDPTTPIADRSALPDGPRGAGSGDAAASPEAKPEPPAAPEAVAEQARASEAPTAAGTANAREADGAGDTDTIVEGPEDVRLREATTIEPDWQRATSARRIAIELKRVETEVRTILDAHHTRRKRKLMGTRRWRELEEDMIRWHYTNKMDQAALKRLSELIPRRHFLFQRLEFLAGTRVGWNT